MQVKIRNPQSEILKGLLPRLLDSEYLAAHYQLDCIVAGRHNRTGAGIAVMPFARVAAFVGGAAAYLQCLAGYVNDHFAGGNFDLGNVDKERIVRVGSDHFVKQIGFLELAPTWL